MPDLHLRGLLWESDLDLVIVLDALAGGPATRRLFREAELEEPAGPVSAARSVSRECDGRETDVLLEGSTGTLLVENKLDADFQPGQPESYREEVKRLSATCRAAAVLVCPERHRARLEAEAGGCFAVCVSVEDLADDLAGLNTDIGRALAKVLRYATTERPQRMIIDPAKTAWGLAYRALVDELLPVDPVRLGQKALVAKDAVTAWFLCPEIDSTTMWGLGHVIPDGVVGAYFYKSEVAQPDPPPGAQLLESKKLWSVQFVVPRMSFSRPPDEQVAELEEAMAAVTALRAWLRERSDQTPP